MIIPIPFCDRAKIRVCERVETVNDSYDIVDVGLEYRDGSIDSLAVGGSFSSLKKWTSSKDSKGDTPTSKD